ncbi:MAG: HD-GYP domain-containing protein [Candidatus Thiodiazotropha sp. (ex Ctena orbiculata)]|nr:HD-GYP domain-containing protein [Candidatus Thiodiazotropha taylori]
MIKQIETAELRIGMYVHKLEASWVDHPFLRNQFKIKQLSDINKIRKSGIKAIYIDTDKGLDIAQQPIAEPPAVAVQTEPAVEHKANASEPQTSVQEEMTKANQVRHEAGRVISNIMADARLGKQIDTERAAPVVEEMLASIFRNQDAFLGLTRIRQMDRYTFEHSVSVSALMIAFGKKLQLDQSTIWELGVGGILHDIGKLQVPDKILNKPGRLSDQEFDVMRLHVGFGYKLIDEAETIPKRARQVILQHHERLNGTGYPGRLSGEEISLYGKMAAIVDVYDAITSDRVYHKGKLPSLVLRQLVEWSGEGVFDAELVQRFIQCVGIYPVGSLVALQSQRLAVVIASPQKALLNPLLKVIYDLRKQRPIAPEVVDLSDSVSGGGDRIVKPVTAETYNIQIEDYLTQ